MTNPAADLAVIDLKSPIFKARPGWGGKLGKHFARELNSNSFSIWLAFITFALSFYSVRAYAAQEAANDFILETATSQPVDAAQSSTYVQIVPEPGQGSTQLARRAVDEYLVLEPDITLSDAQRRYVENYLARRIAAVRIKADESLLIDVELYREAVTKARLLFKSPLHKN